MTRRPKFRINTKKAFPQLQNAPVVEAVIQWQVAPPSNLTPDELKALLESRFRQYVLSTQHQVEAEFSSPSVTTEVHHRSQWDGYRLTSADGKYICQWKPNTLAFSRLAPYENWQTLIQEATPFWESFLTSTAATTVERIGVRFISQIAIKRGERVSDFVQNVKPPLKGIGLRSESFLHQDTFPIESYPYKIRLVRATQPAHPPLSTECSLIVDIDVFTVEPTSLNQLESRLDEMRFLKNEVFFAFMKDPESKFE